MKLLAQRIQYVNKRNLEREKGGEKNTRKCLRTEDHSIFQVGGSAITISTSEKVTPRFSVVKTQRERP